MHFLNQLNLTPRSLYSFNNFFNSQPEINWLNQTSQSGELKSTIISGKSGSGVTHILNAICNEFVKLKSKVMFITSQSFFYVIKKLRTNEDQIRFENELLTFDVIAIDNIQYLYRKAKKISSVFFNLLRKCMSAQKLILIGCSDQGKDVTKSNRNFKSINFKRVELRELSTRDVYAALKSHCSIEDQIPEKLLYAISGYNGTVQEHINCLVSIRFSDKMKNINSENLTVEQFDELFSLKNYFPMQQFRKCYLQTKMEFNRETVLTW